MRTLYESLLDINDVETSIDPITMIDNWCKDNIDGQYMIDKKTLVINSSSSIKITNKELERFPSYIHFGTVRGSFSCNDCVLLTSLKGAPKEVREGFSCLNCTSLVSLKGCPKKVGKEFYCMGCTSLTSLEGASKEVGTEFSCSDCTSLKSLEGAPKEVGGVFIAFIVLH